MPPELARAPSQVVVPPYQVFDFYRHDVLRNATSVKPTIAIETYAIASPITE